MNKFTAAAVLAVVATAFTTFADYSPETLGGQYSHVQLYVDGYEGDVTPSSYHAFVIDASEIGGFSTPYTVFGVIDWAKEYFTGDASAPVAGDALVTSLDYASDRSYDDTLGFVKDGLELTGDYSDYFGLAVYEASDGTVYGRALSSYGHLHAENLDLGSEGPNSDWVKLTPEPTSGLLILLGFAGLALRRKNSAVNGMTSRLPV